MTTVSIDEAVKTLPALLERAQTESVFIRDEHGTEAMLLGLRPRTEAEHKQAVDRMNELAAQASAELEVSLGRDGITVEEFLAGALADV